MFIQAALEPASREKWSVAFLSVVRCREAFHNLGVQVVAEFDSD
jgi:hypothetical protein